MKLPNKNISSLCQFLTIGLPRTSHTCRLVFVICFKIRKLSGYIFHLHLVTECDNVERSVVIVKLLTLNYGILQDHKLLVQLWSQLTVWTTQCPSANQNTTGVLIIRFQRRGLAHGLPVASGNCLAVVKHTSRVLPWCCFENKTQCQN
jgi:hypothetical protein